MNRRKFWDLHHRSLEVDGMVAAHLTMTTAIRRGEFPVIVLTISAAISYTSRLYTSYVDVILMFLQVCSLSP